MKTIIQNKKTKKLKTFTTQQYKIGTYVIEDNDPMLQYGLDMNEKEFHKDLKNNLNKNWKWISTV